MTTLQLYTKGARVWIRDDVLVWIGGELKKDFDGKCLEIELEDGREIAFDAKTQKELPPLRNPDILLGENDLTTLSYLHEPAVLHNLQVRFLQSNAIYTYCGIVLVAINPYEQLPLYGPDIISAYSGQSMGDMDPHIFAIAEDAYRCMSRDGKNQSIIVSGESGAGKTVSAKYAMRYFATVGGAAAETQIEKKVLASNPIMEAIGNAKTIRNDNSSRFGKYLEISFDKNQHIIGANMRTYLLEKARVVFQSANERNYHIFYQLCASSDLQELKDLRLAHQENFRYLNQGESPYVDDVDDAECFEETREAMDLLGISEVDQMMIFRIFAAVLHLGNVEIQLSGEEESMIENDDFHLALAAELLGIDRHQLQKWICNRKIVTVGEVLIKPLNAREAKFGRDALAKHIYSQVFKWVVRNVNKTLASVGKQVSFIGVLDIYGFETFEVNSFEQFCINYANEKLQQQFTQHVFKLEQEEYMKEEIEWSFINFYDNQPCIDLIEAKLGILDLLNEECKMPKGSDLSWAQKLYKQHLKKGTHFDKPRMGNDAFLIHHFADVVEYSVHGFVLKNRDRVNEEHLAILRASEFEVVADVIQCQTSYELVGNLFSENEAQQNAPRKRASSRSGKKELKTRMTVGSEFSESLQKLMGTLNGTEPHYIRCIKPNDGKAPFTFEPIRAMQQLRACGVLETVRISAAGYPSRWTYPEFFNRYRMIIRSNLVNRKKPRDTIRLILETIIKDEDKFQLGKTKIFFRAGQVAYLEKLRSDKLRNSCIMIQKNIRCWRQHRQYVCMRKAAIIIQAWVRGHLARRLVRSMRETKAAITIQRYYRGYVCRSAYLYIHESIVLLQSYVRGMFARKLKRDLLYQKKAVAIQRWFRRWMARKRYRNYRKSIILIQCCVRRIIAKRELKKLKIEARSVDHLKKLNVGMENKIIELQQKLTEQVKETVNARSYHDELEKAKKELDEAKQWRNQFEASSSRLVELELVVTELRSELESSIKEKKDLQIAHEEKTSEKEEVIQQLKKEVANLREELAEIQAVSEKEKANRDALTALQLENQRQQLLTEFEAERRNHQRLIRENARLEQRYQNLQEELEIIERSPLKSAFTDQAEISASSSEASVVEAVENDTRPEGDGSEALERGGEGRGSLVSKSKLVARLKRRIQELEGELLEMQREKDVAGIPTINVEKVEGEKPTMNGEVMESDKYEALRQEKKNLETKNDELNKTKKKIGPELEMYKKLVSQRNIDKEAEWNLTNERMKDLSAERNDLRSQVTRLKKELINMASFAKKIADLDDFLLKNPGDTGAYASQANSLKEANSVLQRELEDLLTREQELKEANDRLWKDKTLQRGRGGSLVNATDSNFQQEVARLVTENVELREQVEKLEAEVKDLKKESSLSPVSRSRAMSALSWRGDEKKRSNSVWTNGMEPRAGKYVMKHAGLLKRSNTKEEDDLLPVPHLRQKSRGMIEYSPEDEEKLIRTLIIDMNPASVADNIPGLPAHILFMCIRHADHMNDDRRMQSLLSSSINSIRKVVKKYNTSFDYLAFWLANTCRLLHHMKQYSGDRAFQAHNTTEQNEQCLKNFDLTEYRQLLSDSAIHIYQDLVKAIWDSIQHMIVPGMLEYEAIPGMTSSKPFGGRKRANADITVKSLTKQLSRILEVLNLHCVNPEIIKQAFRQIFYCIGSNMMNNLLLRKDMCHWSRGMQIRFNLSQLEDWVRVNQMDGSGITEALECVTQATQLLQVNKKTLQDVDAICEVCSKLNTLQVQKILTMYTPDNEYEARVPSSVIRAVVARGHNKSEPMYLMVDTNYLYPVTLPFTPSAVCLDTVNIPEHLNLDFIKVV